MPANEVRFELTAGRAFEEAELNPHDLAAKLCELERFGVEPLRGRIRQFGRSLAEVGIAQVLGVLGPRKEEERQADPEGPEHGLSVAQGFGYAEAASLCVSRAGATL